MVLGGHFHEDAFVVSILLLSGLLSGGEIER